MIGLYGGTCNNMYVFAKAFAQSGLEITFIQDRKDNFPHSQPVWEDVESFFQSGFDYRNIDWEKFEAQYGWERPAWYFSPVEGGDGSKEIFRKSPINLIEKYLSSRYLRSRGYALSVFEQMQKCDALIVCGIEPAVLARLSGKPYLVFPHGSDMRVAIGAERKGSGVKGKIIEWLATRSFKKALCVGSHIPDASAEVPLSAYRRLKKLRVERVALPYESRRRLPSDERSARLQEIFRLLDLRLPEALFYAFSPSRINFHWKGHDRLLEAVDENRDRLDIHFIFLGWGDDYLEAMEYVRSRSLEGLVTVIPVFLSKAFLYRFFEAVDFIIDEFNGSGSYGTGLAEAMSRGCPVMTWISDMFDRPGWERPPVINARSKEEIAEKLIAISQRDIDLDKASADVVAWFGRVHSRDAVVSQIKEKFANYLN